MAAPNSPVAYSMIASQTYVLQHILDFISTSATKLIKSPNLRMHYQTGNCLEFYLVNEF